MYSWIEKGYSKRADRTDGRTFYRRSYQNGELEIVHDIEETKQSKISLIVSATGVTRFVTPKNVKPFSKKQVHIFIDKLEQLSKENISIQKWIEEIGPIETQEKEKVG